MKKYLLDTNIITYLEKSGTPEYMSVVSYLDNLAEDDELSISILSIFEYQLSISLAADSVQKARLQASKQNLLDNFQIENLRLSQETVFGELYQAYKKKVGGFLCRSRLRIYQSQIAMMSGWLSALRVSMPRLPTAEGGRKKGL